MLPLIEVCIGTRGRRYNHVSTSLRLLPSVLPQETGVFPSASADRIDRADESRSRLSRLTVPPIVRQAIIDVRREFTRVEGLTGQHRR